MVRGIENELGHVRGGESDKGYRTGKGRDHPGKKTRREKNQVFGPFHIDPDALGIVLSGRPVGMHLHVHGPLMPRQLVIFRLLVFRQCMPLSKTTKIGV